jgi:hypothetical protein
MHSPDRFENDGLSEKELEDFREKEEIRLIKFFGEVFYFHLRFYLVRIYSEGHNPDQFRNLMFDTAYDQMNTVDSYVAERVRKIINDNFYKPAMRFDDTVFVHFCIDACRAIQQADYGIRFVGSMAAIEERYRKW